MDKLTLSFKITFDDIFLLMKHEIFLKSNEAWNISEIRTKFTHFPKTSFSILGFIKYCLTSSVSQTFAHPNFRFLLLRSPILNISIISFSSSLNRLNALSARHKLEPIGKCTEPELRLQFAKPCSRDKHCTTASLIKVLFMKVGFFVPSAIQRFF